MGDGVVYTSRTELATRKQILQVQQRINDTIDVATCKLMCPELVVLWLQRLVYANS